MVRERREQSILEQAHAWRTAMAEEPSSIDRKEFEAWLHRDARHRRAYERAGAVWDLLADVERPSEREARRRFSGMIWIGSTAAVIFAVVFLAYSPERGSIEAMPAPVTVTTEPGEVRTAELGDGSTVTLGGASEMRFTQTHSLRRVRLLRGDAFFEVLPNEHLPFVVEAGPAEIRVLGTSFSVEKRSRETSVLVASGNVSVSARRSYNSTPRSNSAVSLQPGYTVRVTAERVAPPRQIDAEDIGAWRSGRVVLKAMPLRDVVKTLDRYDSRSIALGYTAFASEPVTATLRLDDVDGSLLMLSETFDLEIDRSRADQILLTERN